MLRKSLPLIAALTIVIASAPGATAQQNTAPAVIADLCFHYQKTGGGTLVAKRMLLPAVNTCAPLAMFENGGLIGAATGSICVDNEDFTVIFHYTYDGCLENYFESGTCRLQIQNGDLPTVSSSCRVTLADGTSFLEIDDGKLEHCNVASVPGGGGSTVCSGIIFSS